MRVQAKAPPLTGVSIAALLLLMMLGTCQGVSYPGTWPDFPAPEGTGWYTDGVAECPVVDDTAYPAYANIDFGSGADYGCRLNQIITCSPELAEDVTEYTLADTVSISTLNTWECISTCNAATLETGTDPCVVYGAAANLWAQEAMVESYSSDNSALPSLSAPSNSSVTCTYTLVQTNSPPIATAITDHTTDTTCKANALTGTGCRNTTATFQETCKYDGSVAVAGSGTCSVYYNNLMDSCTLITANTNTGKVDPTADTTIDDCTNTTSSWYYNCTEAGSTFTVGTVDRVGTLEGICYNDTIIKIVEGDDCDLAPAAGTGKGSCPAGFNGCTGAVSCGGSGTAEPEAALSTTSVICVNSTTTLVQGNDAYAPSNDSYVGTCTTNYTHVATDCPLSWAAGDITDFAAGEVEGESCTNTSTKFWICANDTAYDDDGNGAFYEYLGACTVEFTLEQTCDCDDTVTSGTSAAGTLIMADKSCTGTDTVCIYPTAIKTYTCANDTEYRDTLQKSICTTAAVVTETCTDAAGVDVDTDVAAHSALCTNSSTETYTCANTTEYIDTNAEATCTTEAVVVETCTDGTCSNSSTTTYTCANTTEYVDTNARATCTLDKVIVQTCENDADTTTCVNSSTTTYMCVNTTTFDDSNAAATCSMEVVIEQTCEDDADTETCANSSVTDYLCVNATEYTADGEGTCTLNRTITMSCDTYDDADTCSNASETFFFCRNDTDYDSTSTNCTTNGTIIEECTDDSLASSCSNTSTKYFTCYSTTINSTASCNVTAVTLRNCTSSCVNTTTTTPKCSNITLDTENPESSPEGYLGDLAMDSTYTLNMGATGCAKASANKTSFGIAQGEELVKAANSVFGTDMKTGDASVDSTPSCARRRMRSLLVNNAETSSSVPLAASVSSDTAAAGTSSYSTTAQYNLVNSNFAAAYGVTGVSGFSTGVANTKKKSNALAIGLGVGLGVGLTLVIVIIVVVVIMQRKKSQTVEPRQAAAEA